MSIRQVALVNKVPKSYQYFTYNTQNEITYTFWDYLIRISVASGNSKFIPGPNWWLSKSMLQASDAVIYFVLNPESSMTRRVPGTPGPTGNGGFTVTSAKGVICEVYVDGNLPAKRLANIAFHEFMHNRLDVGRKVLSNLHSQGGGGLATPPTNSNTQLTAGNISLLSKNLSQSIPQYTGGI